MLPVGTLQGLRFEAYVHEKILVDGINLTAKKLNITAISTRSTFHVAIPLQATTFALQDNNIDKLQSQRVAVHENGGGYMLPDLLNYPFIDSIFVNSSNSCTMLQMKACRNKQLSNKAATITKALGTPAAVAAAFGRCHNKAQSCMM